jgi:hypothetical protein
LENSEYGGFGTYEEILLLVTRIFFKEKEYLCFIKKAADVISARRMQVRKEVFSLG